MEKYYSGFAHALIFILGAFTGIAFIYLNSINNIQNLITIFVPAIATLLAAYYGAKYAFNFQGLKEKRKEDRTNQIKAKLVIFKLIDMLNNLASYEMQVIDILRNNPQFPNEFLFMGIKPSDTAPMKVEFDHYDLIPFSEGKHINLLSEISVSKSCYHFLLEAIERRSELHSEVQNTLSASGVKDYMMLSMEDTKEKIGDKDFHTLNILTDAILKDIPSNIQDYLKLIDKISEALINKYPSIEVPKVDFGKYLNRNKIA